MTDRLNQQEEPELRARAVQVRGKLESLAAELRLVDDELARLAPQRTQHGLLEQACGALEQLEALGAAALFWGDRSDSTRVAEQLRTVRSRVDAFQSQVGALDDRRRATLAAIGQEEAQLEILADDIYQAREAEERRKLEWIVEREIAPLPQRVQRLAWARGGEDDRRFRRALAASLAVCLLLGALLPMIDLPRPRRFTPDGAVQKRLAQLVRQEQARPVPPPPLAERPLDPQEPKAAETDAAPPTPIDRDVPRPEATRAAADAAPGLPGAPGPDNASAAPPGPQQKVAQAGILAFRDRFASLAKDRVAPRIGADARFIDAGDASQGQSPSRSMLTSNVPGSSGGINIGSLSRNVGGGGGGGGTGGGGEGGGGGIEGVQVGRATSAIASIGGEDRPKARAGMGPSRTDEEIQIVFDRYKASFYRLYNRELRNNPTLQGQMVLRLTIEPDGSVSLCVLQSSDMDAPALAEQVLGRVRTINFGAKEGVQAVTIVYPIDFLPAA